MDARTQIESQIAGAVVEAAKSPDNAMTMKDAKDVSEKVAAEIAPIVVNQTNQEPWYQSNVTLGALLIVGGDLAQTDVCRCRVGGTTRACAPVAGRRCGCCAAILEIGWAQPPSAFGPCCAAATRRA